MTLRLGRLGLSASLVLAVSSVPTPVHAACSSFLDFGQYEPNCGGSYCYVASPGTNTPGSILSAFWAFSAGNPAPGFGSDNGSWPDDAWLLPEGTGTFYLSGYWSATTAIDGCIDRTIAPGKPAEIMVVALSDQSVDARFGYFAVAAARRILNGWPQFDFTFVAGGGTARDIDLVMIPQARIVSMTRTSITFSGPSVGNVGPGFYADASLSVGEAIVGYRIYSVLDRPTSRLRSAGWDPVTGVVPLGQPITIPFACLASPTYYATSLVYESGFESAHLSADVSVSCRCPDYDGDGWSTDIECSPPPDFLTDCDDRDATVYPYAPELCDGKQNACWTPWDPAGEADADHDGYRVCANDCDDGNASIHPGAAEVCNGADDNCDGQADEDADGVDSDGDGVHNACDDCRLDYNPAQSDFDQDGQGDVCDLDDGLIYVFATDRNRIEWQPETGPASWNVYQGDLDVLRSTGVYTQPPGSNPLADRHCGLLDTSVEDLGEPPMGKVTFSLVTGMENGSEWSLGADSQGNTRANTSPCP